MKIPNKQLEPEKLSKIINIGMKEFANLGAKRASLNTILKSSNISKGLFYHYFENKESFYNYLTDFAIDIVIKKYLKEDVLEERDYIKRLRLGASYKIQLMEEYPNLFDFLTYFYSTMTPEEYMELIKQKGGNFVNNYLYDNIDFTLFIDEIPPGLVVKMIGRYNNQILTEIAANTNLATFRDKIDHYTKELDEIRNIFYKKGE